MWHSRLPLFARLFASPDLGLSPHDWINVGRTAGILIAASMQVFVAWRLWSLQHDARKERERIVILTDLVGASRNLVLKIMNASPRGVYIRMIRFELYDPTVQQSEKWNDEKGCLLEEYGTEIRPYLDEWQKRVCGFFERRENPVHNIQVEINVLFQAHDGKWTFSRKNRFEVTVQGSRVFQVVPI